MTAVLCRVTQSSSPSRVPSQMCASPKSSRVFLLMDQVESKSELLLSQVEFIAGILLPIIR